jgi:hypothetical protein
LRIFYNENAEDFGSLRVLLFCGNARLYSCFIENDEYFFVELTNYEPLQATALQ